MESPFARQEDERSTYRIDLPADLNQGPRPGSVAIYCLCALDGVIRMVSAETRAKIGAMQRGHKQGPLPEDTREKIAAALSVRKKTAEAREHMSESRRKVLAQRGAPSVGVGHRGSKSGVYGVHWIGQKGKWRAAPYINGETVILGHFATIARAESAIRRAYEARKD